MCFFLLTCFISGFFDKAKKKILGDKIETEASSGGDPARREDLGGLSGYDPSWWEEQELGKYLNYAFSEAEKIIEAVMKISEIMELNLFL